MRFHIVQSSTKQSSVIDCELAHPSTDSALSHCAPFVDVHIHIHRLQPWIGIEAAVGAGVAGVMAAAAAATCGVRARRSLVSAALCPSSKLTAALALFAACMTRFAAARVAPLLRALVVGLARCVALRVCRSPCARACAAGLRTERPFFPLYGT